MYKKISFFIITIFLILLTTSCSTSFYSKYRGAYLLEKDHIYEEITLDQLYEKMENKEDFVVYYGQKECSSCYSSVGFINKNAVDQGVETIYYLEAKILSFGGDENRIASMQAKIGFDELNTPDAAPRLWCFIDGEYKTGMSNFTDIENLPFYNSSIELFSYYIENRGD